MNYYEPEDVPECASCEQAQKDYAELEREVERWKKAAEANIEENVRLRREAEKKIHMEIYGIGGPLNDNRLGYSKAQMVPFARIHDHLACAF